MFAGPGETVTIKKAREMDKRLSNIAVQPVPGDEFD
jgi:hypothetical protein